MGLCPKMCLAIWARVSDIFDRVDAESNRTTTVELQDKQDKEDDPNHATIFILSLSVNKLTTFFASDLSTELRPILWVVCRLSGYHLNLLLLVNLLLRHWWLTWLHHHWLSSWLLHHHRLSSWLLHHHRLSWLCLRIGHRLSYWLLHNWLAYWLSCWYVSHFNSSIYKLILLFSS